MAQQCAGRGVEALEWIGADPVATRTPGGESIQDRRQWRELRGSRRHRCGWLTVRHRAYLPPIDEPQRTEILGCPVDALSLAETAERARRSIADGKGAIQVSINALKVALADRDPAFRQALRRFDVASADGVPVVWASRILGAPLPGRVNGTDLMFELLGLAHREGLGVYVLGAREAALAAAVEEIRSRYPGLRMAGFRHGYFDHAQEAEVVAEIEASGADILFLALPSPRKEWFLLEHTDELRTGFAMGVGGSIELLAGTHPRAPRWMQRVGLEWLFRLLRDPAGMWRRYLGTNTRFVALLAREWLARSLGR